MSGFSASTPILLYHRRNGASPFHLAKAPVIYDLVWYDTTTRDGGRDGGPRWGKYIPDCRFAFNIKYIPPTHLPLLNFYQARQ